MTIKFGVIGTGAIGQDHIRRLTQTLSGATVTAMTDINLQQAQATAQKYAPAAKVYATGQEVIADPNVDAVMVTSWGPTHEEFVLAAVDAGKFVFCEKPLATTAAGCMRIVKAEVEAGKSRGKRLVQVGFMRPYDKGYRALKNVIDTDGIGAPLIVHCAHRNPAVGDSYTTDMAITDTVIHEIEVLRWLLDDDYATVQVVYPKKTRNASSHLADPQIILMETVKGVRIDVEVFVNCVYGYDIQCEVVGETGIARLPEPATVPMRTGAKRSVEILTDWKQRFIEAYDIELQGLIDSINKEGQPTGPSAWDGYAAAVAADACVKAQKTGSIEKVVMEARPSFYNK